MSLGILVLSLLAPTVSRANSSFEEDPSLPVVYLHVVAGVGASQDPREKQGLADVAAHMLIRGTRKHSKTEFFELVNRLGGQIEVDVGEEGTVVRAAVLSENLDKFLPLLEETLAEPKFTAEELAKLKKEIEGEILELKGDDMSLARVQFQRFFFGGHPYGNPVLGTRKGVASVDHRDVIEFYSRNFSGKTLKLFGSGAAKPGMIEKWFANLSDRLSALHPEATPPAPLAAPVIPPGRRMLIVNKPGTTQAQVVLGGAGMTSGTPGYYAIRLANHSYGGHSFQARLMLEVRVKRGWTYGIGNKFRLGRQPRDYETYLFPKTDDTVPATALTLSLFEDFVSKGITPEEFEFARDSLVNNAPFNYDTPLKRLSNAITEYELALPKGYFRDFAENIEAVKLEEIAPALKAFFKPADLTLVVLGDASKLKEPLSKLPGFGKPIIKSYLED